VRVHGTTGETPIARFTRDEATALRPLAGMPLYINARDLLRRVGVDCAIEVDGNAYSVPWRLIGERVRVRRRRLRIQTRSIQRPGGSARAGLRRCFAPV
jgi:hypothetical protein